MSETMRRKRLYEGKAKVLYEGPEPGTIVQYFKDDATAFNAQKRGTITGKGVLNNRISEFLMTHLSEMGVPTPNIFTGMQCIHGPLEWISVQDMATATRTCLTLAQSEAAPTITDTIGAEGPV